MIARLIREGRVWAGAAFVVTAGALYAAFDLVLFWSGHAPSVALVPIPKSDYYAWQAAFVVPLLLVLWAVYTAVTYRLVRARLLNSTWRPTAVAVGVGYGAALSAAYLLPDVLLFAISGFEGMSAAVRWVAPVSSIAICVSVAVGLRVAHPEIAVKRALGASFGGLFAQAVVGSPLLR